MGNNNKIMITITTANPMDSINKSSIDIHNGIKNLKKAAKNSELAARYYHKAIMFHVAGEKNKAYENTLIAYGYQSLANDAKEEDEKYHALKDLI